MRLIDCSAKVTPGVILLTGTARIMHRDLITPSMLVNTYLTVAGPSPVPSALSSSSVRVSSSLLPSSSSGLVDDEIEGGVAGFNVIYQR